MGRLSLFKQYLLALATTATLSVLLVGGIQAYLATQESIAQVQDRRAGIAESVSADVSRTFDEVDRTLAAIAAIPWASARLGLSDRVVEFQRALSVLPLVTEIALVDEAANELLSVSRVSPVRYSAGIAVEPALVDRALHAQRAYSDVRFDSGKLTPYILFAIRDSVGSKQVAIARINLRQVSNVLGALGLKASASAIVIDQAGKLVAHSNPAEFGRAITFHIDPTLQAAIAGGLPELRATGSKAYRDPASGWTWATWQPVARTNWTLLLVQPLSAAFAPVLQLLLIFLAVMVSVIGASVAVSYWLARRLARPIQALTRQAEVLAAGQFGGQVAVVDEPGEVSRLARSFNAMATDLGRLYGSMENTIAQRTAALEQQYVEREQQASRIAVLEERQRIMRDIHDGVGGHLVGLLVATRNERVDHKQIETMVNDTLIDLRIALDSLAPIEGDIATVLGSLRYRLTSRMENAGIATEWNIGRLPEIADQRRETIYHLQRIVTECITNAIKHSKARKVTVTAEWDDARREIIIEVADDGLGYAVDANVAGYGLDGMRRRAEQIGAEIDFASGHDIKGTRVRLTLAATPVEDQSQVKLAER